MVLQPVRNVLPVHYLVYRENLSAMIMCAWITFQLTTIVYSTLLNSQVFTAPLYSVIDLGDLPGGQDHSDAFGINNSGQITGRGVNARGVNAVVWDKGGNMTALPNMELPGEDLRPTMGKDINERGQVVCEGLILGVAFRAFSWTEAGGTVYL